MVCVCVTCDVCAFEECVWGVDVFYEAVIMHFRIHASSH